MEQIRYVKIPTVETRTEPDTHVEYALQVQGPVRSWTVWHRYNDFVAFAYDLSREFPGVSPPVALPPKTLTSWFSKLTAPAPGKGASSQLDFIEERRHGLERFVQSMITCEDTRWRMSQSLQKFLAPAGKSARYVKSKGSGDVEADSGWVTAASWLDDMRGAEQMVRDVRQCILKRENALTRNEVSISHQCTLQAKRKLGDLAKALKDLERGLDAIGPSLTAGELLRRQDMLAGLSEEKVNLTRMVLGPGVVVSSSDKAALLDGASADANGGTRVLGRAGNAPKETNETRGLDNQGLLQLQADRMKEQDLVVTDFSRLLQRQREMGIAIGSELDLQNQLLSELDQDLDRTGNKLATARRQASQLK
ncbi:hypothetical protein DL89DRAFT_222967 [Linderina pennispora]|uniref:Phox-like protein n=1 Tax=Linderina pennispora TaxID=61395 RepID=A0A1Y1W992_9FUNG|nr:uncharacterized protein DL89DRAFT_222967 [Linderina pennispora]ORX70012.1 hypothetical protein DL89DRAFT_222967 [Linderina pennispora]